MPHFSVFSFFTHFFPSQVCGTAASATNQRDNQDARFAHKNQKRDQPG